MSDATEKLESIAIDESTTSPTLEVGMDTSEPTETKDASPITLSEPTAEAVEGDAKVNEELEVDPAFQKELVIDYSKVELDADGIPVLTDDDINTIIRSGFVDKSTLEMTIQSARMTIQHINTEFSEEDKNSEETQKAIQKSKDLIASYQIAARIEIPGMIEDGAFVKYLSANLIAAVKSLGPEVEESFKKHGVFGTIALASFPTKDELDSLLTQVLTPDSPYISFAEKQSVYIINKERRNLMMETQPFDIKEEVNNFMGPVFGTIEVMRNALVLGRFLFERNTNEYAEDVVKSYDEAYAMGWKLPEGTDEAKSSEAKVFDITSLTKTLSDLAGTNDLVITAIISILTFVYDRASDVKKNFKVTSNLSKRIANMAKTLVADTYVYTASEAYTAYKDKKYEEAINATISLIFYTLYTEKLTRTLNYYIEKIQSFVVKTDQYEKMEDVAREVVRYFYTEFIISQAVVAQFDARENKSSMEYVNSSIYKKLPEESIAWVKNIDVVGVRNELTVKSIDYLHATTEYLHDVILRHLKLTKQES